MSKTVNLDIPKTAAERLARKMSKQDARAILSALAADGLDYSSLTPKGRQEIRDAIDVVLASADT